MRVNFSAEVSDPGDVAPAPCSDSLRCFASGGALSSIGPTYGRPVGGVVSVLFTCNGRVFFGRDDNSIRVADDWERDEVMLQMLIWRDRCCVEADALPEWG
jgi:hypothetical protein